MQRERERERLQLRYTVPPPLFRGSDVNVSTALLQGQSLSFSLWVVVASKVTDCPQPTTDLPTRPDNDSGILKTAIFIQLLTLSSLFLLPTLSRRNMCVPALKCS